MAAILYVTEVVVLFLNIVYGELCSFSDYSSRYCSYGCCTDGCCGYITTTASTTTDSDSSSLVWEIIGSILGVVIVTVGVTACYRKRRRGQAGNVIRRNQPVEANPSYSRGVVTMPGVQTAAPPYPQVNPSLNAGYPHGYAVPVPAPPSYNEAIASTPQHNEGKDAVTPPMNFPEPTAKPSAPDFDDD